jgi:hypothetical protein
MHGIFSDAVVTAFPTTIGAVAEVTKSPFAASTGGLPSVAWQPTHLLGVSVGLGLASRFGEKFPLRLVADPVDHLGAVIAHEQRAISGYRNSHGPAVY